MTFRKNHKNKFIISVLLLLIFNVLLFVVFAYLYQKIDLKKEENLLLRKQLFVYERRSENAKRLDGVLHNTEEQYAEVASVFVDEESIVNFIEEIEHIAQKTNLDLEMRSIVISEKSSKDEEEKLAPRLSFTLQGSFGDTYYFLFLLENNKYQLSLNKVYLEKSHQEEDFSWTTNIELEILSVSREV